MMVGIAGESALHSLHTNITLANFFELKTFKPNIRIIFTTMGKYT